MENLDKTDVETFKTSSIKCNAIHEEHDLDVNVHETAEKDITRNDNDESDFIISQTIAIARKDRQQIKQLVCVFWFE